MQTVARRESSLHHTVYSIALSTSSSSPPPAPLRLSGDTGNLTACIPTVAICRSTRNQHPPPFPPRLPSPADSVQELIETAPGDIECPTCSQPLTVDLSGGSPGAEGQDEEGTAESDGVRQRGRKGTGSGSRGASVKGGRKGGGRGGGSAKGRMAGMVAALEASLKKVKKKPKTDGAVKRSVTKHSVINRIDLAKFQSVS